MHTVNRTLVSIGVSLDHERHRILRPDNVDAIAESMKAQGQLQPIVVRERPGGRGYWLVAGRHRLEAARKLKWKTIRCEVLDEGISADQAELAEIDENLIRAELTPAEMAMHTARRKELYEKIHPKTKHGGAPPKRGKGGGAGKQTSQEESFVSETAKKTGKGRSTVARNATRGKNVTVLTDILGTCLDSGKELDALGKLSDREQRDLADRAKAGEKVTARSSDIPKFISQFTRTDGQVKAACDYNPEDPGDVAESDADTPEIIRHRIFMYRATEALRLAREFGFEEASRQEITDDVVGAAIKAAEAWSELTSGLRAVKNMDGRASNKQAGEFHHELMDYVGSFRSRVERWCEAHPDLNDDGKACLIQALELCSDTLQKLAQALDGR